MLVIKVSSWILLSLGVSCIMFSGLLIYQEVGEVNRKLPDEDQIPYLGMYPGKMARIKREYKRLYPAGRVEFWRMTLQLAGFGFLILLFISEALLR